MSPSPKVCLVSGTGGYLGSRVKETLTQQGWRVVGLTRNPRAPSSEIPFQLGQEIAPSHLAGAQALVHCAYDFQVRSWADIHAINVEGSAKLLRSARNAGIGELVYISSISAFDGCRSLYGKAKLECEGLARGVGAAVIRPGLIHGEPPGGMYGRLVDTVEKSRMLPLMGGGSQTQFLVHDQDLCAFVSRCAAGAMPVPEVPVTVAHEQPWTFREMLEEIGRARGRRLTFIRVPWRLVWIGIKVAESCGIRLAFRSDSLISLVHQNPNPSFAEQRKLGVECRRFCAAG